MGLFNISLIDFAGPLSIGLTMEKYLIVTVQHLIGWPIALTNKYYTSDEVLQFFDRRSRILFCATKDDRMV